MADIQKGRTFSNGDTVTAADLNNLVDLAVILDAFISSKADVSPAIATDRLVVSRAGLLKQVTGGVVSSVDLTMPAPFVVGGTHPVVSSGTIAVTVPNQLGNVFYCSPVFGTTGQPLFRHITSPDMVLPPVNILGSTVDWRAGNFFWKAINTTGANGFALSNGAEGQTVRVQLYPTVAGVTVTWPVAVRWEGGISPVQTAIINHVDIYEFTLNQAIIYGKRVVTNAF